MADPSRRRVLITGSSGFVGRHLVALLSQHAELNDLLLTAGREPGCDVALDLADVASVRAGIRSAAPDVVYHLAGEASVAQAGNNAAATWQVNLVGTMALAEALADVKPSATLLFVSSAEVYGRAFLDGAVDEAVRPAPTSVYAQAKLAAEQMLAAVLPASATLIVARPSNHIGPGQDARFALPSFAQQLARAEQQGEAARIQVGNLDGQRDFMDVRDVVQAYDMLVRRYAGSGGRETFNVSSQCPRSIRSLLDRLREHARVPSEVSVDPARLRPSEVPLAAVRSARLRELTGWQPTRLIEATLSDVLDDARQRAESRRLEESGAPAHRSEVR